MPNKRIIKFNQSFNIPKNIWFRVVLDGSVSPIFHTMVQNKINPFDFQYVIIWGTIDVVNINETIDNIVSTVNTFTNQYFAEKVGLDGFSLRSFNNDKTIDIIRSSDMVSLTTVTNQLLDPPILNINTINLTESLQPSSNKNTVVRYNIITQNATYPITVTSPVNKVITNVNQSFIEFNRYPNMGATLNITDISGSDNRLLLRVDTFDINNVNVIETINNATVQIETQILQTDNPQGIRNTFQYSISDGFSIGNGFDNYVLKIIQDDDKLVVGGNFQFFDGINDKYLTKLNKFGERDSISMGSGLNGEVNTIVKDNNTYILGGTFTQYNANVNRILKISNSGGLDNTFFNNIGVGANGRVNSIIKNNDGEYVIGGEFTQFNNQISERFLILYSDGTIKDRFTRFNSPVRTMIQDNNGKYLLGGDFTEYNRFGDVFIYPKLIRLNSNGEIDDLFIVGSGFDNRVNCVIHDNSNKYVVVGTFITYRNQTSNRIVRLLSDGTRDTTFNSGTGFNNFVHTIIQDNQGKYVVGGFFTSYNNQPANGIIRLNENGTIDTTFNAGNVISGASPSGVYSIIEKDNGYFVGGSFLNLNNTTSNNLIKLNYDGSISDYNWVNNSTFLNVPSGSYTAHVRDQFKSIKHKDFVVESLPDLVYNLMFRVIGTKPPFTVTLYENSVDIINIVNRPDNPKSVSLSNIISSYNDIDITKTYCLKAIDSIGNDAVVCDIYYDNGI